LREQHNMHRMPTNLAHLQAAMHSPSSQQ
jgi:hypothetical protein